MPDKPCSRCRQPVPEDANFCPACGHALAARVADPLLGAIVAGRYLVHDKVGEGGSGSVYRAEHTSLRKRVAIKAIHPHLSGDEAALERFRREAMNVSRINNDHMLQVFDFGRLGDGRLFFAMEFLEGESLANVIAREGRLAIARAIDIILQAGESLLEAHSLGFVHRDLKPHSLFLCVRQGRSDFVKLLDFGLSKLLLPDAPATTTVMGLSLGDPRYLSPEQARGETIDRRADIYSLGAIAYEALTGAAPFASPSPAAILDQVLHAPPPSVRALRADCPAWLDQVVQLAMAKRADERFVTVLRMIECLRLARAPVLTDSIPTGAMPVLTRPDKPDQPDQATTERATEQPTVKPLLQQMIEPAKFSSPASQRAPLTTMAGMGPLARPAAKPAAAQAPRPMKPLAPAAKPAPLSGKPGAATGESRPGDGKAHEQGVASPALPPTGPAIGVGALLKSSTSPPLRPAKPAEADGVASSKVIVDAQQLRHDAAPRPSPSVRLSRRETTGEHELKWFESGANSEALVDETTDPHTRTSRFARLAGLGVGALILAGVLLIILWPHGKPVAQQGEPAPPAFSPPTTSILPPSRPALPREAPPPAVAERVTITPLGPPPATTPPPGTDTGKTASLPPPRPVPVPEKAPPPVPTAVPSRKPPTPKPHAQANAPAQAAPVTPVAKPAIASPEINNAPKDGAAQADFYIKLGRQRLGEGDYSGAIQQFNQARQYDANNAAAYAGLGECAFEQGNFSSAVANFRLAAQRAPGQVNYILRLGQAFYKQGKLREAVTAYKLVLKKDPYNQEARDSLTVAQSKLAASPDKSADE